MQQRSLGTHRPAGLPARPRHDDVGPRHRRARGARPAHRLRRGRRHPGRHRGRLHRRRLRGADRHACIGDVVARDEIVLATKAGISRRSRRAGHRHLARLPAAHASTPRCAGSASTTSTCGRCTSGPTSTPARGDADRPRPRRCPSGRASYVGISNYTGWQTAQAATWQRAVPGRAPLASTQVEYSLLNRAVEREVLPACAALGLGVLPWSPLGRGVLTGKYRSGTPSDSRGASRVFAGFVGAYLDDASARDRRGGGPRRRRPGLDPARGRPGLGARPARRHRADRRRPHRRPAARLPRRRGQAAARRDRRRPRRRVRRRRPRRRLMPRHDRRAPRPGVEWEFDRVTFSPRVPPQRGDQAARRARRARRLGARPGADRPRRHPPGGAAPQDHPRASAPPEPARGRLRRRRGTGRRPAPRTPARRPAPARRRRGTAR